MAEVLTPPPAPTPAPVIPAPSTPTPSGSDTLMAQMDEFMAKPEKSPEPVKAPEKVEPQTPLKGADGKFQKAPEKKEEGGPSQLRKRLAEVEADLTKTRTEKESTVRDLQTKMQELEKRPFLTKDQQERYDQLEKRAKDLEANLYAQDYSQSPEYSEKYTKRWENKYNEAAKEIGSLRINLPVQEGEEPKFRPATQADFERVRSIKSIAGRLDAAEQLFGNRASLVVDYCKELDVIERSAQEDVSSRRANYDKEIQEKSQNHQNSYREFTSSAQAAETQLQERYAANFGKSDDPEEEAAREKGMSFVDSQPENETPQAKGFRLAMIRQMAGNFQRTIHRLNKIESALEAANETIKKLQGSDPGAGGEGGQQESGKSNASNGTAGLMDAFSDDKVKQ